MSCIYCMQYAMQGYDAYPEGGITKKEKKDETVGSVLIAHRLTGWHEANRVPGYIALVNIMPGKFMAKLHRAQDIFPLSAFTDTS